MRLVVALFCLLPMAVFAQSTWDTWEADGKTIAGICNDDVNETCVVVYCEIANGGAQIAFVSVGAWAVQAGAEEAMVLRIGAGDPQIIKGEIASAPGFGLEFYAVAAPLSPSQISGLRASSKFDLAVQNGAATSLPLSGSSAAISRALAPSCG
ncbi:hypothetical protein SLH49_03800 [Cognatiyoonia sp. IB215446]|uniref:hypothetical protein n=1 Tax=Cognatiyoonia sp. IB215446 TaxID=3097355 RepID=UPI002A10954C|nr:hypothetical protein [Cognatiyoonia sp. IB215446]MDX8347102.1 hypothetical protein [Cognatiyoonia sp. IB215446]